MKHGRAITGICKKDYSTVFLVCWPSRLAKKLASKNITYFWADITEIFQFVHEILSIIFQGHNAVFGRKESHFRWMHTFYF